MAFIDLITFGDLYLGEVSAAPTAGEAAEIGSLASFDNGGAGELYLKTGAASTAWEQMRSGSVDLSSEVTGTLPIANGGTGQTTQTAAFDALSPSTTKGDVIVHNGTDNIRLGVGSDGQHLIADAASGGGVKWESPIGLDTVATVSTTDATVTTIATIDLSTANEATEIEATFIGNVTGGAGGNAGDSVSFRRSVKVTNLAGVLTAGIFHADKTDKDAALSGYAVSGSISGTDYLLRVQGGATDNTDFKVAYKLTQV